MSRDEEIWVKKEMRGIEESVNREKEGKYLRVQDEKVETRERQLLFPFQGTLHHLHVFHSIHLLFILFLLTSVSLVIRASGLRKRHDI